MKVLVIDNREEHLKAATQTLLGHEVTVCATVDEADELLAVQYNTKRQKELEATYRAKGMNAWSACKKAQAETLLPYWDAVLCDLMMPAGSKEQQNCPGHVFVGQEMPVG